MPVLIGQMTGIDGPGIGHITLSAEECRAAFLQEFRHTFTSIVGRDDGSQIQPH